MEKDTKLIFGVVLFLLMILGYSFFIENFENNDITGNIVIQSVSLIDANKYDSKSDGIKKGSGGKGYLSGLSSDYLYGVKGGSKGEYRGVVSYTFKTETSEKAKYKLVLGIAKGDPRGCGDCIEVEIDNVNVYGKNKQGTRFSIPSTGSDALFKSYERTDIPALNNIVLSSGNHIIKIKMYTSNTGGDESFSLRWIKFVKV